MGICVYHMPVYIGMYVWTKMDALHPMARWMSGWMDGWMDVNRWM